MFLDVFAVLMIPKIIKRNEPINIKLNNMMNKSNEPFMDIYLCGNSSASFFLYYMYYTLF